MWLRVLGSAAGGGFPQWNCSCPSCSAARTGSRPCRARSQSSVAVSADREEWFLVNASPDVQAQVEACEALHPADGRSVPVRAVVLTDAELDHTIGLLLMREGRGIEVHATESVHETLTSGTGLLRTLAAYCPVTWRPVTPGADAALGPGLTCTAFDVPTDKRPRFPSTRAHGRVVGLRFGDSATGGSVAYLPCVQQLTDEVCAEVAGCDVLLVDGTCWSDDELPRLGQGTKTSREMGHVPISGPHGSLDRLARLPVPRKVYTHMNNTNPILLEDSPERSVLDAHGIEVAVDGMEIEI